MDSYILVKVLESLGQCSNDVLACDVARPDKGLLHISCDESALLLLFFVNILPLCRAHPSANLKFHPGFS